MFVKGSAGTPPRMALHGNQNREPDEVAVIPLLLLLFVITIIVIVVTIIVVIIIVVIIIVINIFYSLAIVFIMFF